MEPGDIEPQAPEPGSAALHPGFCNGPLLVNPFFVVPAPGSCFCTGSAHGRHQDGYARIGRSNLRKRALVRGDILDGGLT